MANIFRPEPVKNIDKYCRNVGLILIGLGVLHFILSGILSSWWGALLIIIGIISLCYRAKSMLIIFGSALILVGILNISNIIYEVSIFWLILGLLQVGWGIGEIRKYKGTKENPKYIIKKEEKKDFVWYGLRVVLGLMILFYVMNVIYGLQIQDNSTLGIFLWFFVFLLMVIFVVGLIISILHLRRYKKKGIAIVTLLFSIVMLSFFAFSFIQGLALSQELGGIADSLEELNEDISSRWNLYAYEQEEERAKEYLEEKGYEIISLSITNFSANAPFFEWYDIEDDTICADETFCYSDKVDAYVIMKSLGNRNEQVWDTLNILGVVYKNAFTYRMEIKSPTDTCKYIILGETYRSWVGSYNLDTRDLIQRQIDELEICE